MRLLIAALSCFMMSSCGTLISGTEQRIKINAYDPLGKKVKTANCYVRDANNETHKSIYSKDAVHVQRSRHPLEIACLDNKFRTQTYNVHSYNNSEIYTNFPGSIPYYLLDPKETLLYHLVADRTPDRIKNDITRTATDIPDFIWNHRLGFNYVDYASGAYWEYPHNIDIQFSSGKTITNYEYSHKPIPIPKGINYVNLME